MSINQISNFIPIINRFKEEFATFFELTKKLNKEKIPKKQKHILYLLEKSREKIKYLLEYIKKEITKLKNLSKLQNNLNHEKNTQKLILEKISKFSTFIENGKKILTNNITYFEKLQKYSSKKLKTASLPPLDFINFTLRLTRQYNSPIDGDFYFSKYLFYQSNDPQEKKIMSDYFQKNKNRYLYPYPTEEFEMKNTILRYDLSTRLLPPEVSPISDGNSVPKGTQLIFKYPKNISDVFFKFSSDPKILPSSFSGELYLDNLGKTLDNDCVIKVCSCKKGFKDSEIITLKYIISNEDNEKAVELELDTRERKDQVERPEYRISSGNFFQGVSMSPSGELSPQTVSRPGTSSFEPNYGDYPDDNEDDFP